MHTNDESRRGTRAVLGKISGMDFEGYATPDDEPGHGIGAALGKIGGIVIVGYATLPVVVSCLGVCCNHLDE